MEIRLANDIDRDSLFDIWVRSVQATHSFVSREDIHSMIPQVREYLACRRTEFWVVCSELGGAVGFMGMSGNVVESLFLVPDFQRRGLGKQLVAQAQSQHSELQVDVNEQNTSAVAFYHSCGFVSQGRSEVDDQGRPYPLLHMKWARPIDLR